tara:strand:+ start:1825 stop:2727 length:903 start_codon:yes stop_codon:yes gene_type:complete
MNNFNYLENNINDSIFIENEKQLKKYQKKLRQSKNQEKIKEFTDAIEEYIYRHRKTTSIDKKISNKTKSTVKVIETDEEILDKAINENKGKKIIIVSNKFIKEKRRIHHIKNVNRKLIESKISGHIKRCMRKYFIVWIKMNKYIQKNKNNMINLFKYTQVHLVLNKIITKWKFHSDYMIARNNLKVSFYKKNQKNTMKYNIIKYWFAVVSGVQCSICYETHTKDNIVKTNCGHEFCNSCIENWKTECYRNHNDATCPLCRQVFEYRPIGLEGFTFEPHTNPPYSGVYEGIDLYRRYYNSM